MGGGSFLPTMYSQGDLSMYMYGHSEFFSFSPVLLHLSSSP